MQLRGIAAAALAAAVAAVAMPAAAHAQAAGWTPYDRPATYGVVTDRNVPITMRDGTVLAANVQRPDKPGRYPVLVTQTAYDKDGVVTLLGGDPSFLVRRGYVVVTVDVRGTGSSQGTWDAFGEPEQRDGYDTVEWAAAQPWSDGDVGLSGGSYLAITQLTTAAQRPPHLRAIFPIVPLADGYRDIVFSGGDINSAFIPLWLGLVTAASITPTAPGAAASLQGLVDNLVVLTTHLGGIVNFQAGMMLRSLVGDTDTVFDGPFWKTRSPIELADRIDVPTFVVGGLHDIFQRGEPLLYERLKRRVPARLLIGPWTHTSTGTGLPAQGVPDLDHLQLRWFDHWLKGLDTDVDGIPKVTQYVYGTERWETSADWPDPRLDPQRWYLRGDKGLSPDPPAGPERPQSFVQHPLSGICTMSTGQWTAGALSGIPCAQDERPNELSGGVTYTSAPMRDDVHLNGPIGARLWLTTTASDAAVTVRVSDVQPGGEVRPITSGWQTASLRATDPSKARVVRGHVLAPWHPFTQASLLRVRAGAPMPVDVEVFPTDLVLEKGHRLRITVDPADFPHQIPPIPSLLRRLGGRVTVLTDPGHPSAVELPVVGDTCAVKARAKGGRHRRHGRPRRVAAGRAGASCPSLPVPDLTRAG